MNNKSLIDYLLLTTMIKYIILLKISFIKYLISLLNDNLIKNNK